MNNAAENLISVSIQKEIFFYVGFKIIILIKEKDVINVSYIHFEDT